MAHYLPYYCLLLHTSILIFYANMSNIWENVPAGTVIKLCNRVINMCLARLACVMQDIWPQGICHKIFFSTILAKVTLSGS